MAAGDIRAFASPHGGTSRIHPIKIAGSTSYATAETSWQPGEIVLCTNGAVGASQAVLADSAGTGIAHDSKTHFIAVNSSQGELSLYNIASATATIPVMGSFIPVMGEQEFITRNIFTASDALIVPANGAAGGVGDICGWYRDNTVTFGVNGRFGIDTALTGLVVTRVLDANFVDIGQSGAAGVWCVFKANGE